MWDYELRSVRERKKLPSEQAIYIYDSIPAPLLAQLEFIWRDATGRASSSFAQMIRETYARRTGMKYILSVKGEDGIGAVLFFMQVSDIDTALDVLELGFHLIEHWLPSYVTNNVSGLSGIRMSGSEAIDLANMCFQQHAIGYQIAGGEIVRVDSQFLHVEVVETTLTLLHDAAFKGPSDEFMKAHEDYRHGRMRDAATTALSAFESTMKAIADARGWTYNTWDTAGALIALMWKNNLLPERFRKQFTEIEQLLTGLAKVRNAGGIAHGQGLDVIETPDYIAAYALHQAATNIVLLMEAHRSQPVGVSE